MHGLIKLSKAQNPHFVGFADAWMQICASTNFHYLQILVSLLLVKTFSVMHVPR